MAQSKLPAKSSLIDKQVVQVQGPDGVVTTYQFDNETCTLYRKAGRVTIPPFHGQTHIAEDPVPLVTTDTQGHMSPSDKAKLDALTQTRLGILGFSGAGFPDDGGFLQGDIILASGSELLTIERLGNIIRFTGNTTQQFCGCEECAQIFWIQDESDTDQIRPPSCAGKMPGVSAYGELKVFLLPESTLINPSDPLPTLNQKVMFPALIFKRYDNAITPGQGQLELVLARKSNLTTKVGWSMTPGASGVAETVWFTGLDDDGRQITFEYLPESEPNLLGQLLYKGHSLTRRAATVTGYTPTILSTNVYKLKFWDIFNAGPVGDEFTATNVWKYNNPENSAFDLAAPRQIQLDATVDLLTLGTLVQIWEFQTGEINGERQVRRYFIKEPSLNPAALWAIGAHQRFGDLLTARKEVTPLDPSERVASEEDVSDIRTIDRSQWGITGFDDPFMLSDDGEGTDPAAGVLYTDVALEIDIANDVAFPCPNMRIVIAGGTGAPAGSEFVGKTLSFTTGALIGQEFEILFNNDVEFIIYGEIVEAVAGDTFIVFAEALTAEPSGVPLNNQFVADIDPTLPGLRVIQTDPECDSERPVYVWHRGNHKNLYMKALIGQPEDSRFPPIDVLVRAPIDSLDDVYLRVIRRGTFSTGIYAGRHYIVVKGAHWKDIPQFGSVRTMTGIARNNVWPYTVKAAFALPDDDGIMLIGDATNEFFFDDDFPEDSTDITSVSSVTVPSTTTVVQLLHQEYSSPAARIEFSITDTSGGESVQMQVRGGILSMGEVYELDRSVDPSDDLVRGFEPGLFQASRVYTQQGFITLSETPEVDPAGFKVFVGGFLPTTEGEDTERWNVLEIMYRDSQLWIWWNGLLIPPDPVASASLPTSVSVNTPYFDVRSLVEVGKVGFRLWPGAIIREIEIRDQVFGYNEFTHGQLILSS